MIFVGCLSGFICICTTYYSIKFIKYNNNCNNATIYPNEIIEGDVLYEIDSYSLDNVVIGNPIN